MRLFIYGLVVLLSLVSGDLSALESDCNGDGVVNLLDLAIMAGEWLKVEQPPAVLVQSGWLDVEQNPEDAHQQNLNGIPDKWRALVSCSQNNHIGRDGTVWGAKLRITQPGIIEALGIAIVRHTAGNRYTFIGKSKEITSGLQSGINELVFDSPMEGIRSDDILCLLVRPSGTSPYTEYLDTSQSLPIDDSAQAKLLKFDPNSSNYDSIIEGFTYPFDDGVYGYAVLPVCALMEPPKVIVVGDSISEGAPLNKSYRNNSTNKCREGAYAAVAYRELGWGFEIAGNTAKDCSGDWNDVFKRDLSMADTITVWDKSPRYIHVHAGINDIGDGNDWSIVLADMENVLTRCRSQGAGLIIDAIFPITGMDNNESGTHEQQLIREQWNQNLASWAAQHEDVMFVNYNEVLGCERIEAKAGDPEPVPGNRWDLIPEYIADDGYGVHLNEAGGAVAGSALSACLEITNQ